MVVKALALLDSALLVEERTAVSLDGLDLYHDIRGFGQPVLVFIHGWGAENSFWEAQVAYFAHEHTVVTLDLAGHGMSEKTRRQWSVPSFASDVVSIIEDLNLKQPTILVGHAMGAQVAIEAARRMPDIVIGIIAAEALHNVDMLVNDFQFNTQYQNFHHNYTNAVRQQARASFNSASQAHLVEQVAATLSRLPATIGLPMLFATITYDTRPAIKALKIPVRCINSSLAETNLAALRKIYADVDVMIMPEVNHFIMLENPIAFNQLLEAAIHEIVENNNCFHD